MGAALPASPPQPRGSGSAGGCAPLRAALPDSGADRAGTDPPHPLGGGSGWVISELFFKLICLYETLPSIRCCTTPKSHAKSREGRAAVGKPSFAFSSGSPIAVVSLGAPGLLHGWLRAENAGNRRISLPCRAACFHLSSAQSLFRCLGLKSLSTINNNHRELLDRGRDAVLRHTGAPRGDVTPYKVQGRR